MPEKIICTRPWTQQLLSPAKLYRQQKADIKTPVINTYAKQLQQCDRLYDKLAEELKISEEKLPKIDSPSNNLTVSYHQRYGFTKSAPGTFCYDESNAMRKLELSLTNQFREKRHYTEYMDLRRRHEEYYDDSLTVSDKSDDCEIDAFQLSDILYRRGLRRPILVRYDKNGIEIRKSKTKIIRHNNGILPKNPSMREKIKGRARLDYEMANMRAVAFCERQAQRKFRTASANTRNRDVELVDEDFLDRFNKGDENNDDTGSIIMSIDKEELFERIDQWIKDVNEALTDSIRTTSKVNFSENSRKDVKSDEAL